jgi:hypothetical protein
VSVQRRRGEPVRIWNTITVTDARGNVTEQPDPTNIVDVRAAVIPRTSSDAFARVTVLVNVEVSPYGRVEWNGRSFDVESVEKHNSSRQTRHWTAHLRERPIPLTEATQ